jgi:uncharacterized phiE125 gp8 family phage protein
VHRQSQSEPALRRQSRRNRSNRHSSLAAAATYPEAKTIQILFVAGYGAAADVPCEIKHVILLKVADLYEHRGGDEGMDKNINEAIENLLSPDRIGIL